MILKNGTLEENFRSTAGPKVSILRNEEIENLCIVGTGLTRGSVPFR